MADNPESRENLIGRFYSKNSTHVYDALVKARTSHIKGKTGIIEFCGLGGIKALISVIHRHPVISETCIAEEEEETTQTESSHFDNVGNESRHCANDPASKKINQNQQENTTSNNVLSERIERERLKIKSLESRNTRILDVAFSLLANCCTESVAREEVVKNRGIGIIVSVLKYCDVESISCRVCRTIANLAQTSSNVKRIIKYDILEVVVKRLTGSTNVDSQQNYVRMIRLLGDTSENRELIVEAEGIRPIAELLKSDHDGLVNVCIRALNDLTRECSVGCSRQLLEADCLRCMLELIKSENQSIRKHAVLTLGHITEQETIRPSLGNAGGITCFIDFIRSEPNPEKTILFVNCLCLCCQEVVNRMKIREASGLQLLLTKLKDSKYKRLHPRIISALVHFCTNEIGMKILLENGLVDILMQQLQLCSNTKLLNFKNLLHTVYLAYAEDTTEYHEAKTADSQDSPSITDHLLPSNLSLNVTGSQNSTVNAVSKPEDSALHDLIEDSVDGMNEIKLPEVNEKSSDEDCETVICSGNQNDCVRYSIDSPTYKTVEWSSNDYFKGQKCIGNFDPPTPYRMSSSSSSSPSHEYMSIEPYSPLSTQSLMSSSICSDHGVSPAYSSFSDFSDGRVSYIDSVSPRYSPSFEHSLEPTTPIQNTCNVNPVSLGIDETGINVPVDLSHSAETKNKNLPKDKIKQRVFPTSPRITKTQQTSCAKLGSLDFKAPIKTIRSLSVPVVEKEYQYRDIPEPKAPDQVLRMVLFSKEYEEKDCISSTSHKVNPLATGKFRKRTASESRNFGGDSNSSTSSNITKGRPKRQKHEDPRKFTQRNILYMLSSISHMERAEKYLVSRGAMDMLLSYALQGGMNSHSRCWRLFERLSKNLDCFQPLLEMNFPMKIFHLFCQPGVKVVVRSCMADNSCSHENDSNELVSKPSVEQNAETEICENVKQEQLKLHESENSSDQWRAIDSLNEKGHCFLENLMMIAEAGFGRGVLYSNLINGSAETQLLFAVNASYICRSSFLLRKVFVEYKGLQKLFDSLITENVNDDELHAVSYLLHQLSNIAINKNSLKGCLKDTEQKKELKINCFFADSVPKHDLSFVCSDGVVVTVERSHLASKSEVFAAMLRGKFHESEHSQIKLPDISSDVILVYFHLMYNCMRSNCPVIHRDYSWDVNIQLLGLADRYLADNLQEFIIPRITKQLTVENLVQTCHYSVFYKSMKLFEKCIIHMFSCKMTFTVILRIVREIISWPTKKEILENVLKISKTILE
ncbi:uncharacterized protein LOC141900884 [Tubulanus polymorphus]|uniref:uncharacterized protein LOC141900884 n=1 Tax=Tubulanus polymorphus TaxID=672921 RepID=UPI003DA502EB